MLSFLHKIDATHNPFCSTQIINTTHFQSQTYVHTADGSRFVNKPMPGSFILLDAWKDSLADDQLSLLDGLIAI